MDELSVIHQVAIWGFIIAFIFGAVGNRTHFCTMGAVSDVLHMGSKGRLGAWFAAIGVAMIGAHILQALDLVDLRKSIHLGTTLHWFSYILGGLCFGVGMTLAAGCGQRNLVRIGGGNLKALVVIIIMGISAYMTMRGLFAPIRIDYIYKVDVDLNQYELADQGVATILAGIFGMEAGTAFTLIAGLVVAVGFLVYAFRQPEFRTSFDNILAGVVIGLSVVAAWYVTGYIGNDDFDPVTPQGMSFIGPTGNAISYLMTYTGAQINFGIAIVFGMIAGSFFYGVVSRTFRIETFSNQSEMISHLVGAMLMGFGGVLSFGCTVGQGITGMSTLALGSIMALASIIIGSAITMRVQYHMLDEKRFLSALAIAIPEILVPGKELEA